MDPLVTMLNKIKRKIKNATTFNLSSSSVVDNTANNHVQIQLLMSVLKTIFYHSAHHQIVNLPYPIAI
jgi:hypothetical protein